ncbi:MAG: hypothetical protein NVS2B9_13020 [Myxococcales bacterium]
MPNLLLLAAVASVRVGLFPLSLPEGDRGLQDRLAAQLHEGAATLPGVQAFDLLPQSNCAPDEGACLAEVARRTGVERLVTGTVERSPAGYRFHLRVFEQGQLRDEVADDVRGGPLDLAAALEHGVCRALGAAPCVGELQVGSGADVAGQHLIVDGVDRGILPLAPLQLAVGRHQLQVGPGELRVRTSYGRLSRAHCEERQGVPALFDGPASLPAAALLPQLETSLASPSTRSNVARVLIGGGAALLVTSLGAGLYSHIASGQVDARAKQGALTEADAGRAGTARRTGILAVALAATGAGAVAAGGLVLALSPSGASLGASF